MVAQVARRIGLGESGGGCCEQRQGQDGAGQAPAWLPGGHALAPGQKDTRTGTSSSSAARFCVVLNSA